MKKRNNRLWDSCVRQLGLETTPEKRWFITAFILLFLYLWLCQYLRIFLANNNMLRLIWPVIFSAVQVLPVCCFGVAFFGKLRLNPASYGATSSRFRRFFPTIAFVLTLGYLLLWQVAFYPGGFSPDSVVQYQQALTGSYSNWHSVVHTWLFFCLPYQIFHHPAGIVFTQILLFSLAVGNLYRVLYRRNCPAWFMVLTWLFLILNQQTARIMMFPWKDSALTIVALAIFTQLIEIYDTDGAWLNKWYHFLSFSLLCFLATALRHNAILLTAPLYIVLLIFQKKARKSVLFSGLLVLCALFLLNGPVMSLAHVEAPGSRQMEVLGLPMTVLSEVYVKAPEALSEKAFGFMNSLATWQEWDQYYQTGNFNAIKWVSSLPLTDLIEHEGIRSILRYTAQVFQSSPEYALNGFASLTQMVWNPASVSGWSTNLPFCSSNDLGIIAQGNQQLAEILTCFSDSAESLFLSVFTHRIGLMILIAMFAAVANVGRGKLGRAFMVFPMLIYDFGTMLLLTGPDFRFFHFNFVVIIPLLYLILSERKSDETEPTS